jgi:hypothetical protein
MPERRKESRAHLNSLALELLTDCMRNHPQCPDSKLPLPDRVLDLGGLNHGERVQLVDTRESPQPTVAKYLALSYRWGNANPLQLQTSTIQEMKRGIDWEMLPALFRNVIYVCRKLEISYLWIDALCIVQNNEHDRAVQCTKMSKIYMNSFVTLAAASVVDSSQRLWRADQAPISALPGSSIQVISAQRPKHSSDILHSRGWAYQEFLLGPRILEFHTSDVKLHCRSQGGGTFSDLENLSEVGRSDSNPYNFRYVWTNIFRPLGYRVGPVHTRTAAMIWAEAVHMYSFRELTLEADKLPALSGLAALYSDIVFPPDTYLAGLWKSQLTFLLGWEATETPGRMAIPDQYTAPSWSWASIKRPVDYENHKSRGKFVFWEVDLEIREAYCKPKGANPFGEVTQGHLSLRSLVIEASFRIPPRTEYIWGARIDLEFLTETPDRPPTPSMQHTHTNLPAWARNCVNRLNTFTNYCGDFQPDVPLRLNLVEPADQPRFASAKRCTKRDFEPGASWGSDAKVKVWTLCVHLDADRGVFLILGHPDRSGRRYERLGVLNFDFDGLDRNDGQIKRHIRASMKTVHII